jgi:sugar/nucleoside kinase (ribokinase family)
MSVPGGDSTCVIDQGVYNADEPLPLLDYTLLNADWVHVTTGDPSMHLEVAREARRASKKVVFDPAQELHYRYDDRLFERFLDASDVFICNQTEFGHALAKLGYGDVEQLFDHVGTVIVTRGADGLAVHAQDGVTDVPSCPVRGTGRPETTGAGDVFRGGLYGGLYAGKDLAEATRWGATASSLFLESDGAQMPTRPQVEARLAAWSAEAKTEPRPESNAL